MSGEYNPLKKGGNSPEEKEERARLKKQLINAINERIESRREATLYEIQASMCQAPVDLYYKTRRYIPIIPMFGFAFVGTEGIYTAFSGDDFYMHGMDMDTYKEDWKARHIAASSNTIMFIGTLGSLGFTGEEKIFPSKNVNTTSIVNTTENNTVQSNLNEQNYTNLKDVSEYIGRNGKLPNNYITKSQAYSLGWRPKLGNLSQVAPGKSIGGDIFYNTKKILPDASGRIWYEADINYVSGYRGTERILYSNDGLIYSTVDHYKTFVKIEE